MGREWQQKGGGKPNRHQSMNHRRWLARMDGKVVLEREICQSHGKGTCRRGATCRFCHGADELVKLDQVERQDIVGTAEAVRQRQS